MWNRRRIKGYLSQKRHRFYLGFNSRYDRINFVEETAGMVKAERENQDEQYYNINFIK